ncbi:mucin-2-like isoform X2 [Saccostrea echinata]|uniref:mucin-2-like isoform X2 n=1 Tax=Saccostrea echinata TaxID=191078 RepID=UPI002A7FB358|nr:mucin-2-like isoform X2 [Saccostrea echinata]
MANSTTEIQTNSSSTVMSTVIDASYPLSTSDLHSSSDIPRSLSVTLDVTSQLQSDTSMSTVSPSSNPSSNSQTVSPSMTLSPSFMPSSFSDSSVLEFSQTPTPFSESQVTSTDLVERLEELSSNIVQSSLSSSVSSSSDISPDVTSSILSSILEKSIEYIDSVPSLVSPSTTSSQSTVITSSALSSSISETAIPSSTGLRPSSNVAFSSTSSQESSPTFYPASSTLMSSTQPQSSFSSPFVSSTPTQIPLSTQGISTNPIIVLPSSSMETHSPTSILPVLPASSKVLPPGVGSTTEKTNDTVTATQAPVLGTGLELIIALSIIGAGLLIFLVIIICVCWRRKKSGKQEKYDPNAVTEDLWVSREVPLNHVDPIPQIKTFSEVDGGSIKLRNGITHFNTATVRRSYSPAFRHNVRFFDEVDEKYVAIFNFEGKNEEYLTLKEGDVVVVTNRDDNGWWTGSLRGKTGFFPGTYVKEAPPEVEFDKSNRLSNGTQPFEILLDTDTNAPRPVSSFMSPETGFTKRASTLQRESSKGSTLTRHTLGKEVAIPHVPDEKEEEEEAGIKKRRSTISPVKEDFNVEGIQFKVLYNYTANFKEEMSLHEGEIVTGIRKDRNGWMYGRKNRTNEVGHFPAVYVEKATQEDIEAASFSQYGYPDEETVYKQLHVNRTSHHDEDLIGIEHRALHCYAAEDEHDLSFDKGDTILVYEVNDNGWWRGSRGDEVGWFPGSYVQAVRPPELVDEDPTELKYKGPGELTVLSEDRVRSSSFLSVGSGTNISKTSDEETLSICSTGTTDSRRRPVRKAPPPPKDSKSPRTPKQQPPRPPSHVPWANQTSSTPNDKSTNQSQDSSLNGNNKSINDSDSVDGGANKSFKPDIPKRFIKPKLVKVSKKKINLKPSSSSVRAAKSPPPPRPEFPKHIPKSPLNRSKDESNRYSKLNGTQSSLSESQEVRSNSQNNSAMIDSDISGVEALQLSNSSKDQSSVQNKSENGGFPNSTGGNSEPKSREQSDKTSTLSTFKNKPNELSPSEARHSTPKYHETPKFSDPPIFDGKKVNGNVDANSAVPESETSITEVSGLDETDSDMKSPKVPPSPKRSRLPMLSGDAGANAHRARSKERPPPVAPKPHNRISQIQRLRSLERSHSEVDSSQDQSSLQDDSSSILIHDGLDSSNNNSSYMNDSHNQNTSSSNIRKPSIPVPQNPQKSPLKQSSNSSRIPKTASGATKRPSSAMSGKPAENIGKDFTRQTSTTSGGFETASPGKPPTPKPKRPDNPPNRVDSNVSSRRKTSASPSRIPLGKSPTRKPSDSGAKTKIPQNHSPEKKSSDVDNKTVPSKIPTAPSTEGQRGNLTKASSLENQNGHSKAPPTDAQKGSPSKRGRSAIPKLPRPNKPFVPPDKVGAGGDNPSVHTNQRHQMKKAVSGYEALNEGELSFNEGSLITEISQDLDHPGWCVGRLPDGTTGRYHSSFVEDLSPQELAMV